jgi:hypothetical protein
MVNKMEIVENQMFDEGGSQISSLHEMNTIGVCELADNKK